MSNQRYFPRQLGEQVLWLGNFQIKLQQYAAALELDPDEVTAILLDVDNALYGLGEYRGSLAPAVNSGYTCIENALYGKGVPQPIRWMSFSPPPGMPEPVNTGCLNRVFQFINKKVRKAPGYTKAIGLDLGVEAFRAGSPSTTVAPELKARLTSGNKMEVLWKKGRFEAVKLEFDLGEAGMKADFDLHPNYTLNWLPPTGTPVVVRVRAIYVLKGEEFGNWSDWLSFTLTGP